MTAPAPVVVRILPGVVVAVLVAGAAYALAEVLPAVVGPVLLAVVLGLAVGNTLRLPTSVEAGLRFSAQRVLRVGVILLGARLTFADVAAIGLPTLATVVVTMSAAFLTVAVASRLAGVSSTLATLIGVGTAVCGNSAIVATAPIVDADDREVSLAVGTITLFGTLALLTFPTLVHLGDLPDAVAGFWVGLAVNDTSQVVAAGAAISPDALDIAVVVKLVRNALMAPLIVLIAWRVARRRVAEQRLGRSLRGAVPLFVLGFLALAAARSFGIVDDEVAARLGEVAGVLITVAIAAVGLRTRLSDLRRVGIRPVLVGLGAALVLAVVAYGASWWLGATY